MSSELVQLSFEKIMQTHAYTIIILGCPEKRFAIYADPSSGKTIQLYLTGAEHPRPLTHDLLSLSFRGLGVKIKQIVLTDIQEAIFFARLFLEQQINGQRHILEIDARPSDCITLALMNNVPVYCTQEVLQKTVAVE